MGNITKDKIATAAERLDERVMGPTGTGKTELFKATADLVFEDEDTIIWFDMSEHSDSNSYVKLIGSPPGYVRFDEGGS